MEYTIDEKNYRIQANGSKNEIKTFARCLVEVINKHYANQIESTPTSNEYLELNPTSYERIYIKDTSLLYLPNIGSEEGKKFHFNILMVHYRKARDKFEKLKE